MVIKHSVNLSYHGISQNVFYKTQILQDNYAGKMFGQMSLGISVVHVFL